jgi:hypothetical protein
MKPKLSLRLQGDKLPSTPIIAKRAKCPIVQETFARLHIEYRDSVFLQSGPSQK